LGLEYELTVSRPLSGELLFSSQPCIQGAIPTLEFVSFAGVMVNEGGEGFLEIDPELDCQRAVMRVWLETFGHWNRSRVDVRRCEPTTHLSRHRDASLLTENSETTTPLSRDLLLVVEAAVQKGETSSDRLPVCSRCDGRDDAVRRFERCTEQCPGEGCPGGEPRTALGLAGVLARDPVGWVVT
jgi:hypothetical protein